MVEKVATERTITAATVRTLTPTTAAIASGTVAVPKIILIPRKAAVTIIFGRNSWLGKLNYHCH